MRAEQISMNLFSRTSLAFCILIAALYTTPVVAETLWISDNLTVPLRSGPSSAHRILHRGLPAGTKLDVLGRDTESNFVQIRTDNGLEGWLPSQYLVSEPIARDLLVAANAKVRDLTKTVETLRGQLGNIDADRSEAEQSNAELQAQVLRLTAELADIRRISAGAVEQNETNKELHALNERLRAEVGELVSTIAVLEDNIQQRWMLIGGGLVLGGLVLGISIKARPRRSAWS